MNDTADVFLVVVMEQYLPLCESCLQRPDNLNGSLHPKWTKAVSSDTGCNILKIAYCVFWIVSELK